jgi:hypothetical protein
MTAAGYAFDPTPIFGEGLNWKGGQPLNSYAAVETLFRNMFLSPGTRATMLDPDFREGGVGMERGFFLRNGVNYDANVLTTDFATNSSNVFVTGYRYFDSSWIQGGDRNGQHSPGEGSAYALQYTANQGPVTLTFNTEVYYEPSPTPETLTIQVEVEVGARNIRLDVQNGNQVFTDTSLKGISGDADQPRLLSL